MRQVAYIVARAHKPAALGRVLDMENPTSAIVFCRTRIEVDELAETLNAHGYRAEALHGGMAQEQRDRVMEQFRAAKTDLLVATDVAARGLDIEHLSHVVNYDVPSSPEVVRAPHRPDRAHRAATASPSRWPSRASTGCCGTSRPSRGRRSRSASVPTVADLRARRLELTRASLRERLLAGGLEDVRVVVESLAEEFDLVDIAAAAVKMAHEARAGAAARDEKEIPVVKLKGDAVPSGGAEGRASHGPAKAAPRRTEASASGTLARRPAGKMTRLYVAAGRQAGVRPADLVGAITGEAGVGSRVIGSIEIGRPLLDRGGPDRARDAVILVALRATKIRGARSP